MAIINELMIVTGQMLAFAINALLHALIHDTEVWRTMLASRPLPPPHFRHGEPVRIPA
ncbi:hypothetical protein [Pseudarthrobacter sp. C1]|uniref:hypothetical protein n=1 Tax=Pseudarthrobacter sp. C1 TaxID=3108940 RepID=UPI002B054263|nr:hypothetical protein [Pseudarthrobacter sp. C1]MEA3549403.1 hypothetical protein [Pseudarthrobacter sp. C1]